jgi:ABC-type multidrug transport system fused ATPase/permease subunit
MEHISVWIAIVMGVVVPVGGFIFNSLITKRNDELKELFFKRLDEEKMNLSNNYVRKDLYEQAMKFHVEHSDEKFKSMMQLMTNQYENVEDKIEELKKLINDKFNGHQK